MLSYVCTHPWGWGEEVILSGRFSQVILEWHCQWGWGRSLKSFSSNSFLRRSGNKRKGTQLVSGWPRRFYDPSLCHSSSLVFKSLPTSSCSAPLPQVRKESPLWEQSICNILLIVSFGTKESLSLKRGVDLVTLPESPLAIYNLLCLLPNWLLSEPGYLHP